MDRYCPDSGNVNFGQLLISCVDRHKMVTAAATAATTIQASLGQDLY